MHDRLQPSCGNFYVPGDSYFICIAVSRNSRRMQTATLAQRIRYWLSLPAVLLSSLIQGRVLRPTISQLTKSESMRGSAKTQILAALCTPLCRRESTADGVAPHPLLRWVSGDEMNVLNVAIRY